MPRVLVTGGAGYIGAHTVRRLLTAGHDVAVLDDLSVGHRDFVPAGVALHVVDLADAVGTDAAVAQAAPDAVVHFAGATEAGLSMTDPARFYRVNVVGSWHLAEALRRRGSVAPVVYSSSAAVYGQPDANPIPEEAPKRPESVYGRTKHDSEGLFAAYDRAYGLRSIALRYFNAAGASPEGGIGELHDPETHLVPLAMRAVGTGVPLRLFGTDYPTPDGTCVRDYVHVDDLADAHVLAVRALLDGASSDAYNVGVGSGFSNREVLACVGRVLGTEVPIMPAGRRAGDPAELYADPSRLRSVLGWRPAYTDLDSIVGTAAAWYASQGPTASAAASKNP